MLLSKQSLILIIIFIWFSACQTQQKQQESSPEIITNPLPSWSDTENKKAIMQFVESVTDEDSPDYRPPSDRIAVFDNDGTLWSERPVYFQLYFALDRIRAMAAEHPEWKNEQPFKAVLEDDMQAILASGEHGLLQLIMASHSGMTTTAFEEIVKDWISTARHPETGMLFKEMVYLPMLELLDYLRANEFKTYIVSGGGIEFMRPWTEEVYGIPPEQVIGSSIKTKFEMVNGNPQLIRLPEIDFIDDKEGKPVAIHKFIGKRPIAAFGNSDGDLQMLQWTEAGEGKELLVYIHHTDSAREWAYDRNSHVGKLDKGLDEALSKGWIIVDMKGDWNAIYMK